jgi:phosphoglycolate/pyridoxal phosphate phosphatase family enzyme
MRYGLYILDLDGTVYRGAEPIPGAADTISVLRADGSAIRFLTNNSGKTRSSLAEKLSAMGIACAPGEVWTSGVAAAMRCLERRWLSAFVVGEAGLVETLRESGIEVVNADDGDALFEAEGSVSNVQEPTVRVDVVVAGICRAFTYRLMSDAMRQIRLGAKFLATNRDATYPLEGGRVEPGAGSIVAAIEACSGVVAEVVGKPSPTLIQLILKETGVDPGATLVVGDRFETDLEAGIAAGCDVVLALTGVTDAAPAGVAAVRDLRELLLLEPNRERG